MNISIRSKLPLLFLIGVSIFWGYYYQSNSALNDYGAANFEWLYLIDGLLVLPILCFLCIKNKKEALLKSVLYGCLVVLIGSYIVPEQSKLIWHYLESGRYLVVAMILVFELIAISTVYLSIKAALNRRVDPDLAISEPIKRFLGESILAQLLSFETRMWTYALFSKAITFEQFSGDKHFSYHQKDGTKSNLLGFILMIIIEIPIMHLLLHFIWSPTSALVVTLLTIFSLVFFIAEYRAVSKRPVSLVGECLVIRYGIYQAMTVPLNNIDSIHEHRVHVARSKFVKRYNYSGTPNVAIKLVRPVDSVKTIYIGIDIPAKFIDAVNNAKGLCDNVNN